MPAPANRAIDLFVAHAWRAHADFDAIEDLLHSVPGFGFRNFGLPWHDPAYHPSTELGATHLNQQIRAQMIPAQVALFLPETFQPPHAAQWLDIQVDLARRAGTPILVVAREGSAIPAPLRAAASEILPWNGEAVVGAIRRTALRPER